MKRIVILTTGGTIAMRAFPEAGGAIPALGGADFTSALPQTLAELRTEEFSNLPSAHFGIDQLWELSRRLNALVADDQVDGVVVTHGTDTLEESAYLSDLTIDSPKPVVFTGAMRTASDLGYEGLANLSASVRVAASDAARDLGTLVVFNDEIYSARDVTKGHPTALETFRSTEFGPLGRVDYAGVLIAYKPLLRDFIPAKHLDPNVHLLKAVAGGGTQLLDYLVGLPAHGIVLEALGGGRVPPAWLPSIDRAVTSRIAVVITSRAGSGRTVDRYGYEGSHHDLVRLGCWFANGLDGIKARIKLMAALGTSDPAGYFTHA